MSKKRQNHTYRLSYTLRSSDAQFHLVSQVWTNAVRRNCGMVMVVFFYRLKLFWMLFVTGAVHGAVCWLPSQTALRELSVVLIWCWPFKISHTIILIYMVKLKLFQNKPHNNVRKTIIFLTKQLYYPLPLSGFICVAWWDYNFPSCGYTSKHHVNLDAHPQ